MRVSAPAAAHQVPCAVHPVCQDLHYSWATHFVTLWKTFLLAMTSYKSTSQTARTALISLLINPSSWPVEPFTDVLLRNMFHILCVTLARNTVLMPGGCLSCRRLWAWHFLFISGKDQSQGEHKFAVDAEALPVSSKMPWSSYCTAHSSHLLSPSLNLEIAELFIWAHW